MNKEGFRGSAVKKRLITIVMGKVQSFIMDKVLEMDLIKYAKEEHFFKIC